MDTNIVDRMGIIINVTQVANESLTIGKEFSLVYRGISFVVATVTIVTNFIVVISSGLIIKNGLEPKSCYMLLGNVSLADTLAGIAMIIRLSIGKYADSIEICIFQIGLIVSPTLVSIFSVGMIAVDRYIYILHGLYYRSWINTKRVRISILITWIIGLTLGFLPITDWTRDSTQTHQCLHKSLAPPGLLAAFLPILLVCILYSIILFHALRKTAQLRNAKKPFERKKNGEPQLRVNRGKADNANSKNKSTQSVSDSSLNVSTLTITSTIEHEVTIESEQGTAEEIDNKQENKGLNISRTITHTVKKKNDKLEPNKWRAIKVVFFTTASFVCTWCPYLVVTTLYLLCDKTKNNDSCLKIIVDYSSPLGILGFLNSVLNPIIYAWWHRGFKTAVKKIFCKICNGCRNEQVIPKIKSCGELTHL